MKNFGEASFVAAHGASQAEMQKWGEDFFIPSVSEVQTPEQVWAEALESGHVDKTVFARALGAVAGADLNPEQRAVQLNLNRD